MGVNVGKMWVDYGYWLTNRIRFDCRGYHKLIQELHSIPFRWVDGFEMDQNRAEDGKYLRGYYGCRFLNDGFETECSVLEMLIALSERIEVEYIGRLRPDEDKNGIFWEILCNLGLDENDDRDFLVSEVRIIVDDWLDRRYSYSGRGGIFPLDYPRSDQRDLLIWDQMLEYINERY